MIPVKIMNGSIAIINIEHSGLDSVLKCVNESAESCLAMGRNSRFTYKDVEERYMETLLSSLEFFCGIYIDGEFAGIIKGRLENKNRVELWILSFILMEKYRNKGIGTKVVESLENYFSTGCNTSDYYVIATQANRRGRDFWVSRGYNIARIAKNIYENQRGTIIYEKGGKK
jgi:ribosomal protein S18 acetylase RimI-like enzyme